MDSKIGSEDQTGAVGFNPDIQIKKEKQSDIFANMRVGFYPFMIFNPVKYGKCYNFHS